MLNSLLKTNVYVFAMQLIVVLMATNVICMDFNSSFLSSFSDASINWILQSRAKASLRPFRLIFSLYYHHYPLLPGLKGVSGKPE